MPPRSGRTGANLGWSHPTVGAAPGAPKTFPGLAREPIVPAPGSLGPTVWLFGPGLPGYFGFTDDIYLISF